MIRAGNRTPRLSVPQEVVAARVRFNRFDRTIGLLLDLHALTLAACFYVLLTKLYSSQATPASMLLSGGGTEI